MENISTTYTNFVLVGLVQMESLRFLYALLTFSLYSTSFFVSSMIVYVTWTEESLHEPMYIFICGLVLNVMFGSSAYLPKLLIDLLSKNSTISLSGCLFQAFCMQTYAAAEIFTFTVIAYDRYLAVAHPLRYSALMTNLTSQKLLLAIWVFVLLGICGVVLLTARLTFCGVDINNVYCETMSLLRLSCGDITVNNIYGITWTLLITVSPMLLIIYCYIKTIVICLKLPGEASQKAAQTLVTHAIAFSIFMVGTLFIVFRYRLSSSSLSTVAHVVISMSGMSTSITVNPLIYGIRTKALRIRIARTLQKILGNSK
ncbi:putative gustatory receptor clone PTE03 [Rana temporaria]|uniref:putative gustatory receptor clone PTE03 n=1 Tax=Rana temporaria TaxID=8407 RepID=UPI001AAD6088|nr:putative gustatory receptor clone PTE03 [Rana temporaria]